jgi:hypothetical protein
MADVMQNLWPTDFEEPPVLTPVAILRQQGQALGQRTQNIVVGRVKTYTIPQGFRQTFELWCAPLGYATEFLWVDHGIDLYPATIHVPGQEGQPMGAGNPDELGEKLKQVFASARSKKIIGSLLAQSKQ